MKPKFSSTLLKFNIQSDCIVHPNFGLYKYGKYRLRDRHRHADTHTHRHTHTHTHTQTDTETDLK